MDMKCKNMLFSRMIGTGLPHLFHVVDTVIVHVRVELSLLDVQCYMHAFCCRSVKLIYECY